MNSSIGKCPKCGHVRTPNEASAAERCPACGLYFAKWAARDDFVPLGRRTKATESLEPAWHDRWLAMPEGTSDNRLIGNAVLLLLFSIWGIRLALMDYRDGEMGASFMHAILLPIHEAGHVLFMPFGEFMTILGGSLFQLLLPLIAAAALLRQNRDPIGAALGVWWCGASWMDLAAYIYDAMAPQLILLGGHTGEDGPHDWIFLLERFGAIRHAQTLGALAHKIGMVLIVIAIAAAAAILVRHQRARRAQK